MSEVDDEEEKSGTQVAGAGNMDVEHVPLAGGFQKGDRVRGLVAHAPMNVKVGDEGTVVGPSSTYEQKSTTAEETSTVDGKTGERGGRREGAESGEGGEGGEKGGGALLVLREMLLERNPESRSTILRETLRGEAQNLEKNPESRTTNYTALPGGVKRRRVAEEEDGGGERELTTTTTTPTASSATPVRRDTQIEREGGREREPVRTMDATKAAVGEKRKLAEHFGGGGGGCSVECMQKCKSVENSGTRRGGEGNVSTHHPGTETCQQDEEEDSCTDKEGLVHGSCTSEESLTKGSCTREEGSCTREEGSCTREEGSCTREEGSCTREEGSCTREEGSCTREEGSCTREEGSCTREEGSCTREEGSCTREEGSCSIKEGLVKAKAEKDVGGGMGMWAGVGRGEDGRRAGGGRPGAGGAQQVCDV
jgi:hypothetical protein